MFYPRQTLPDLSRVELLFRKETGPLNQGARSEQRIKPAGARLPIATQNFYFTASPVGQPVPWTCPTPGLCLRNLHPCDNFLSALSSIRPFGHLVDAARRPFTSHRRLIRGSVPVTRQMQVFDRCLGALP